MSAPRRRKKYPPLRLVETPKRVRLPEAVGFREHALEQFKHWERPSSTSSWTSGSFALWMLYESWCRKRGADMKAFEEPDYDEIKEVIYAANEARESTKERYPRLATLDGVRVQA